MMHHTPVDSHRNFVLQTHQQGASFGPPLSDTIVILKPDGENYTTLLKAPQTMQLKKATGSIKDKRFVRTQQPTQEVTSMNHSCLHSKEGLFGGGGD
eukprot:scaffold2957_cov232-Chaetoceros_neogracile.AAC.12